MNASHNIRFSFLKNKLTVFLGMVEFSNSVVMSEITRITLKDLTIETPKIRNPKTPNKSN